MKIVLIVDQMEHGGAGRVAAMVANGLVKKGHDIIFMTNTNKPINYLLDESVE